MSTVGALMLAVRKHPWVSAADAIVVALATLVTLLLALEYDILMFWSDLSDGQRLLRVEEMFIVTGLLGVGVWVFMTRRMSEAREELRRTERFETEARTNRALAMQDPLTDLPNRRALHAALDAAIATPPKDGEFHAFYLLDLNGFKRVNDEHGHATGDEVLRVVAKRFRSVARKEDLVARMGGDEFAVLACNVAERDGVTQIGRRFVGALDEAVTTAAKNRHSVGVAIGVALFPDDGRTVDEIIHRADLAMYKAKSLKRSDIQIYAAA